MSENSDLQNMGNFLILITSGSIIPLLLVIYKSRCKSICWGCIKRDVLNPDDTDDDEKKIKEKVKEEVNEPEVEP